MRLDTNDFTRLRQLFVRRRQHRRMKQREAAAGMGMNQSQLSDLESGRIKDPRLSTLVRWASGIGYHLDVDLRSRTGTADIVSVPRTAVSLLVASAVDRLWSQWHNEKQGCCIYGCCADCAALHELMETGWLDTLYGTYVTDSGSTGHAAWDPDRQQIGRDWLIPAWKDPHDGCAYHPASDEKDDDD